MDNCFVDFEEVLTNDIVEGSECVMDFIKQHAKTIISTDKGSGIVQFSMGEDVNFAIAFTYFADAKVTIKGVWREP